MKSYGYLSAILDDLEKKKTGESGRLTGQLLINKDDGLRVLVAVDSKGFIHILFSPCAENLGRLKRIKLKSLILERKKWLVSGNPVGYYLDIKCNVTNQSPRMTPFLGFCEDILDEIDKGATKTEDVVYRTCMRWRRFWSDGDRQPFTQEWLRGLLGEVLFLEALFKRYGDDTLEWWTGPERQDHDFQIAGTVCEVKTTGRIPATVRISNLNQLDNELMGRLYLTCFRVRDNVEGISLVDVVKRIEIMLNDESLDAFVDKLAKAGYQRNNESEYSAYRFEVSEPLIYRVDGRFPKITMSSFKRKLDARIVRVLYDLELTGMKATSFESVEWIRPSSGKSGKGLTHSSKDK
jgi:Putative  PD-(D/E)XK family member, (DUF4420)